MCESKIVHLQYVWRESLELLVQGARREVHERPSWKPVEDLSKSRILCDIKAMKSQAQAPALNTPDPLKVHFLNDRHEIRTLHSLAVLALLRARRHDGVEIEGRMTLRLSYMLDLRVELTSDSETINGSD